MNNRTESLFYITLCCHRTNKKADLINLYLWKQPVSKQNHGCFTSQINSKRHTIPSNITRYFIRASFPLACAIRRTSNKVVLLTYLNVRGREKGALMTYVYLATVNTYTHFLGVFLIFCGPLTSFSLMCLVWKLALLPLLRLFSCLMDIWSRANAIFSEYYHGKF